jgi:hypothetical protein
VASGPVEADPSPPVGRGIRGDPGDLARLVSRKWNYTSRRKPPQPCCQLAARWALNLPGVTTAGLRLTRPSGPAGRWQMADGRWQMAENAGFALAGTVTQFVPGARQMFEDLRCQRSCLVTAHQER